MELTVHGPEGALPVERAHVVSLVIKSFKGRRDVEVHLFRSGWEESELGLIDWDLVLTTDAPEAGQNGPERSRRFLMEAFTAKERDLLIEYLRSRYEDRLKSITSVPLELPLPPGITPLGEVPLGGEIGVIRFEKIPRYTLPFTVHGLFDLSRHKPVVEMSEEA
jgi:hypothetical protein